MNKGTTGLVLLLLIGILMIGVPKMVLAIPVSESQSLHAKNFWGALTAKYALTIRPPNVTDTRLASETWHELPLGSFDISGKQVEPLKPCENLS